MSNVVRPMDYVKRKSGAYQYQNYLARNLSPSINFSFEETEIDGKRVVVLVVPAATEIPTAFFY